VRRLGDPLLRLVGCAGFVLVLIAGACSDGPSLEVAAPSATSAVDGATTAATSTVAVTAAPTSTLLAVSSPVSAVPGQRLVIERKLPRDAWRFGVTYPQLIPVSFAEGPLDPDHRRLVGEFGTARIEADGRVMIEGVVRLVMVRRSVTKAGEAEAVGTPVGNYVIERMQGLDLVISVTAAAPAYRPTIGVAPSPPNEPRVLRGDRLFDVPIGADAADAERRLRARLGAPTEVDEWRRGCVSERLTLTWDGLDVMFDRPDAASPGVFVGYEYGSRRRPDGSIAVPATRPFAASHGAVPDVSVADLRAIDADGGVFHSRYLAEVATVWTTPLDPDLWVELDADFLDPSAKVVRIGAPFIFTMTVC
jgi:hypothetical protein